MTEKKAKEILEIAKDRINSFQAGTLKIRPLGKPVHKPRGTEKIVQIPKNWLNENKEKP